MAGPWGFNFRATLGFVTDGPTDSAVLGDLYPTVFSNGLTAGWIDEPEERDRNSGIDPRLAGVAQRGNDGTQKTFRVDLPSSGSYAITLALGDADNAQSYQYVQMLDGATPVLTIADAAGTAFQSFDDATGTEYDAATWPGSNTPVTVTLSGTTLNVTIGSPGVQAGNSTLAHLSLNPTGGSSPTVTPTGFGLTVSRGTPVVAISALRVSPTGIGMTVSRGTPLVGLSVAPTGFGLTMSLGTFTTQNDITMLPVGIGMTSSLGTPTRAVTKLVSGIGMTMSLGTPATTGNPTQVPTGMSMTASLGTPSVTTGSNPTITPSGLGMTFTLGTPTISTFQSLTVAPTGLALTMSLGSAFVLDGSITILLLGSVKQLNTTPVARQLITTPIVRQPHG